MGKRNLPAYQNKIEQEIEQLKKEHEKVVNKNTGANKQAAEEQKEYYAKLMDEQLEDWKHRTEELCFWQQIKTEQEIQAPETAAASSTSVQGYFNGVNAIAPPVEEEEKETAPPFPVNNSNVYHYHPVAFVEQMKRVAFDLFEHIQIIFQSHIEKERIEVVSKITLEILKNAGAYSKNEQIYIASTIRTAQTQAEAMYNNLVDGKEIRYASPGQKVVDIYNTYLNNRKSKGETIKAMVSKIEELQKNGERVSRHCVSIETYNKLNVIDVSYSRGRLKNPKAFIDKLSKEESIRKIIHPFSELKNRENTSYDKNEPAIHIEINQ